MAAPTYRSVVGTAAFNGSTSFAINKPAGTVEGDLLVAAVFAQGGFFASLNDLTPPAGWTTVTEVGVNLGASDPCVFGIYYRIAGASEGASYTWTLNDGANRSGAIVCIQAGTFDATTPIGTTSGTDHTAAIDTTAGTAVTTNGVTPPVNECLGLVFSGAIDAAYTSTLAGWTERVDTHAGTTFVQIAAYTNLLTTSPTGTVSVTYDPSVGANKGAAGIVAVRPVAGGGETKSTTGTISLGLAAAGSVAKTAGATGTISLGLGLADDTTKVGNASGGIPLSLGVAATANKIAATIGDIALSLGLSGDVTATDTRNVTGTISLTTLLVATAAKDAQAAGALALALELVGDTTKLGQVAGSLGITLNLDGTADAIGDNDTVGAIALALAIVATAAKTTTVTGSIGLALGLTGTVSKTVATVGQIGVDLDLAGDVTVPAPGETVGTIALTTGLAGTASKTAATVGALSLVLAIAATTALGVLTIIGPLTLERVDLDRILEQLGARRTVDRIDPARTLEASD